MTPENRTPRKRRRRRRRAPGEGGAPQQQSPLGNGPGPEPGNEAISSHGGGGGEQQPFGRRRRRSRRRGRNRGGEMRPDNTGTSSLPPSIDIAPGELVAVSGVLYIKPNGSGLLVTVENNYVPQPGDAIVPRSTIEKLHLQAGLLLSGQARRAGNNIELVGLEQVEGMALEEYRESRRPFSELISIDPNVMFKLETEPERLTTRVLDLLSPLGRGQRCLVVAPPKAGKTTLLKDIAHGINTNHPEVTVIVLLVDERPEEVTDTARSVKGEVIASTFDRPPTDHTAVAELAIERAKRLVEQDKDVVVLLDSITRLGRAYNNASPASGRILSGGVDSTALYPPKRFLGAARNIEEGGSLTIIASALVETGSRMDEVIFEEFKGTGNSEIRLDRQLSEKRIFPAIDIEASSTRKEELLYDKEELVLVWRWRRLLHALAPGQAMELLRDKLTQSQTNEQFLKEIAKMKNVD
jgi:transcription termination factor Rho